MESTRDVAIRRVAQIKATIKTDIENTTDLVMAASMITIQDIHKSWIS